MLKNQIPTHDGQISLYINGEAQSTRWFTASRRVVFINGMLNDGKSHRKSALALSLLQMCPVVGVYNHSGGFLTDLGQCIADKYQFDGPAARSPEKALDRAMQLPENAGKKREEVMAAVLYRNPSALSLFTLLRQSNFTSCPIFAHSQGNLILSNALAAILAVDGEAGVSSRTVYTFGSPSMNWPGPVKPVECGFTFDPVTWLAGFDTSFRISKIGRPPGSLNPITHGFMEYLKNDAEFIVNRFRWGSFGLTASMDEDGLAACLVEMETNMPRILKILQHLDRSHNSDVDDVAELYVNKVKRSPKRDSILRAIKDNGEVKRILIRSMEEGWTSSGERSAIEFLKSL